MKRIIIFAFGILVFSCEGKINKLKEPTENQQILEVTDIDVIIKRLKKGMVDYIQDDTTFYDKSDVESCINLIFAYLNDMEKSTSQQEGNNIVKETVLKLNQLNEKCNHVLIETDQREDIAQIINLVSIAKGYSLNEEDVTEQWREW